MGSDGQDVVGHPGGIGVGVVLAAGSGSRYRGSTPKVLAPLPDGTTLVGRAVATASEAGLDAVAVVLGALTAAELAPLPAGLTVLVNPRWAEGQATSLTTAIRWARGLGAPAITVGLGDQPGLTSSAWRTVAGAGSPIALATYDGTRGHPVRLGSAVWDALSSTGDAGARELVRCRPDLVTEVPCVGDPTDVDTVEDLAAWARSGRARPRGGAS